MCEYLDWFKNTWISFIYVIFLYLFRNDLQKRMVDKESEKLKIQEDTKELTEKNAKISQEMENMNQELKNVEKFVYFNCLP